MLADFLKVLLRRWRLSATFVVLGLAAAGVVLVLVPPVQESEAAVLFIPPNRDASVDGTVNPFLSLGGSLGVVPSVVQATVTDARTVDKLAAAGHDGEYTVVVDVGQNAAPILRVTADSHTASTSVATVDAVVAEIKAQLLALQTSRAVDSRYYITATVLTSTPEPLVVRTGQIQAAALAAIGVFGLGLGVIGLTSRPWTRAHQHRRDGDTPGVTGGPRPAAVDTAPDTAVDIAVDTSVVDSVVEWSATTTHRTAAIDPSSLPTIGAPRTTAVRDAPDPAATPVAATALDHRPSERTGPSASRRPGRAGVTPRRQHSRTSLSSSDLHRGGATSGRGFGDGTS